LSKRDRLRRKSIRHEDKGKIKDARLQRMAAATKANAKKNKRGPLPCRRERGKAKDDDGLIARRGLTERFNVLQRQLLRALNRGAGQKRPAQVMPR